MGSQQVTRSNIRDLNVVDMVLLDHRFIKECVEVLVSEKAEKNEKLTIGKEFLDVLHKHSHVEREVVYSPLEPEEEFHFNILEAKVEHGLIDEKIKLLRPRLSHSKTLKDEMEAELKVLAELVKAHIKEEESELLPKMLEEIDEETLKEMGELFMKARKLSVQDLKEWPHLEDELIVWKDDVQRISSQFLSKMDKYVENLRH